MSILRLIIMVGAIAIFCASCNESAFAQARLIAIDTPISSTQLEYVKRYFNDIDALKAKVYAAEFEGLTIARVESDRSCLADKCLTIVICKCQREICPHASILAVRDVFSNPLYVDIFGAMRSVAFGRPTPSLPPESSYTVVIFSDVLMLVTAAP